MKNCAKTRFESNTTAKACTEKHAVEISVTRIWEKDREGHTERKRKISNLFPPYYYCHYYHSYYYYFYLISSRLCCVDSCQQPICNEEKNGLEDRKSDHFAFIYGCVQLFLLTVLPQFSAWFGIKLRYVDDDLTNTASYTHMPIIYVFYVLHFDGNDSDKQTFTWATSTFHCPFSFISLYLLLHHGSSCCYYYYYLYSLRFWLHVRFRFRFSFTFFSYAASLVIVYAARNSLGR